VLRPTSADDVRAAIGTKLSLIVGLATVGGAPFVTRGWALTVPDPVRPRCRLILGADDLPIFDTLGPRRLVSVTVTDVRTLDSVQLKGPLGHPEPATPDDLYEVKRYCDAFFGMLLETDGIPRASLDRLVPSAFVACEFDVEALFDQTPGPRAGTPLAPSP
jgi:hypothetical protein